MNTISKIACRLTGAAGIALASYDSAKIAKQYSEIGSEHAQEHYLERAYFNSRTTDHISYAEKAISKNTFDIRTKNPLPALYGKIKGGFHGFFYGMSNYLPLVACSTLALICKSWVAKAGALGAAGIALYEIAREGFGLGKSNPME